ncbi:MAG: 30S ribosomal protein S1 [Desulfovibrio sp.]
MSDTPENESAQAEENFAELFESYTDALDNEVNVGDRITGAIISISDGNVFIETGTKIDGVADKEELKDENGEFTLQPGDSVELYVISADSQEIRLSKALSGIGGLKMLEGAFEGRLPVEGKVASTCKGGFNIEILKRRAFCPVSQIDTRYVEEPEEYVGQTLQFQITKLEQNGRNVVVSRRRLLEAEQAEAAEAFLAEKSVGDAVEGKVVRVQPFGAFVEIVPGVEGLVHVSELGWGRVEDATGVITAGESVKAVILKIEKDKQDKTRIGLSMKKLLDNPWDTADQLFKAGEKANGKVTRLADFGAFVELAPGIEGLVHISEMSYKRILKPSEVASAGDTVAVLIKSIDMETRRISLSMRDAEGDPWLEAENNYSVGQVVEGTVEKQEQFGIFINIVPGVTALLPKSRISRAEKPADFENLKPGDKVELPILDMNIADRKMTLDVPGGKDADTGDWKKFSKPSAPKAQNGGGGFGGLLGDKLQQAMKKKK